MAETTIIAQLSQSLGSIAWAGVAAIALLLFRTQLASLLTRIRKGAGAEFDPPQQPKNPSADILPKTDESSTNLPFARTPATMALEGAIREWPYVTSVTEPVAREQVLVALLARAILVAVFEQVEGLIWASQIALLTHLHVTPDGASPEDLKRYFYEPSASRHPGMFTGFPFDSYLNFLVSFNFVKVSEGQVHITNEGREYLLWRVENRKVPKTLG